MIARLLLALAVFVSVAMQETTLPPDHYCLAGPPAANQPKAHECHCALMCAPDEHGQPVVREAQDCKMYCAKNRCACHADEPCPPAKEG